MEPVEVPTKIKSVLIPSDTNDVVGGVVNNAPIVSPVSDVPTAGPINEFITDDVVLDEPTKVKRPAKKVNSAGSNSIDSIRLADLSKPGAQEQIRNGLKDNTKVKEAMAQLRKDRSIVPNTIKMVQNNPQLQRNVDNMTAKMNKSGDNKKTGSAKDAKKQDAKTALIRSQRNNPIKPGEVTCIITTATKAKGKFSSYTFDLRETKEDKWVTVPCIISDTAFIAVINANILTGVNKLATSLVGKTCYGPVIFVALEFDKDIDDYKACNIDVLEFKDLLSDPTAAQP